MDSIQRVVLPSGGAMSGCEGQSHIQREEGGGGEEESVHTEVSVSARSLARDGPKGSTRRWT